MLQGHYFSTPLGNSYSRGWVLGPALKLLLEASLGLVWAFLHTQQKLCFDLIFQDPVEALTKPHSLQRPYETFAPHCLTGVKAKEVPQSTISSPEL